MEMRDENGNEYRFVQAGPSYEMTWGAEGTVKRVTHEDGRIEETRLPGGPPGYKWTPHGEREWWFEWAGPRKDGVSYPPLYTVHLGTSDCVNLYAYSNGEHPDDENADPDYMHICDVDDHIALLRSLKPLVPSER